MACSSSASPEGRERSARSEEEGCVLGRGQRGRTLEAAGPGGERPAHWNPPACGAAGAQLVPGDREVAARGPGAAGGWSGGTGRAAVGGRGSLRALESWSGEKPNVCFDGGAGFRPRSRRGSSTCTLGSQGTARGAPWRRRPGAAGARPAGQANGLDWLGRGPASGRGAADSLPTGGLGAGNRAAPAPGRGRGAGSQPGAPSGPQPVRTAPDGTLSCAFPGAGARRAGRFLSSRTKRGPPGAQDSLPGAPRSGGRGCL